MVRWSEERAWSPTSSRPSFSTGTTEQVSSPAVSIVDIALWVVQIVLGILLIVLVLVHSGKGGGLSDMFGGGLGASAAGSTVMEKNLDRITVVIAVLFAFNTLLMALVIDPT
ncbi:MAG: preprotein translocase subunit SecG [Actinobacteria bacterium]|nr:preprotein translocase subunit SecG [Actinomycetota bacterium]